VKTVPQTLMSASRCRATTVLCVHKTRAAALPAMPNVRPSSEMINTDSNTLHVGRPNARKDWLDPNVLSTLMNAHHHRAGRVASVSLTASWARMSASALLVPLVPTVKSTSTNVPLFRA
jgi:hypothetical protein